MTDEASLLACAAYVDLNLIRAAMAETLEQSDHTSVQKRIEAMKSESPSEDKPDAFLAPLSIDERLDPVGPCASDSGKRCSDKGFLPISLVDYLKLLDWTARQVAPGKRGVTPSAAPPILVRLGLEQATWCELVKDFGKLFCSIAGRPESVDSMRCHRTHRRYHLRRRARELLTLPD
ncbi:hypothetical protein Q31b_54800 [Novipirellula aureliae]|uniref:Uncharacterized protein n=1 Tax=Novipirellula aureliae TaxID=2527966 RepID=A0A5C6DHK8_9BACT|nr:hypothetical protein Q31b_54800 [Novipirellula aureliae]